MPGISIPLKNATGTLSLQARKFTPGGSGGLGILNITINWLPNQSSGPVSFSFTLSRSIANFPAGDYAFSGNIAGAGSPCPPGALACGLAEWPGPGQDEVPWVATGGPGDDEEDTEESSSDEAEDTEESSEDEEEGTEETSSDEEPPSAYREKPSDT